MDALVDVDADFDDAGGMDAPTAAAEGVTYLFATLFVA